MSKIFIFFIIFIYFYSAHLHGQSANIIVQQGSNSWIYPDINTAISQAPSGAYIYLPGGFIPYTSNSLIINKELHIIGAGICPDSTLVSDYSDLRNCDIYLAVGCDNSQFEGFMIHGIFNNTQNSTISNILIKRLRCFYDIGLSMYSSGVKNNFLIYNCILENGINFMSANNITISNNIIMKYYRDFDANGNSNNSANVFNNLFLGDVKAPYYPYLYFDNFVNLKNNVFTSNIPIICTNSNVKNNIFFGSLSLSSCTSSGNYLSTPPQNVLFSYTLPFSFYSNYSILNGSVGDNGGDDGTDIGIYGGLYPWKEGIVPINSHMRTFLVSPSTNASSIHVNIKVGAQNQ